MIRLGLNVDVGSDKVGRCVTSVLGDKKGDEITTRSPRFRNCQVFDTAQAPRLDERLELFKEIHLSL